MTGFGFLGHLHEMMGGKLSCVIDAARVPVFEEAKAYADEFLLTAAAQRNRNHLEGSVEFENVPFAMEEVFYDPQTSGGLLIAVEPGHALEMEEKLRTEGLPAAIVGEITERSDREILCKM